MKLNKRVLTMVLSMTMTLAVGCSSSNDKKDSDTNTTEQNQTTEESLDDTTEEQVLEENTGEVELISINSYDELLKLGIKSGEELEKLLKENGMEYVISNNKLFASNVDKTYEKYSTEYKQNFEYNIKSGSGTNAVTINSYKEYNIDDEISKDDEFVKLYQQMVEKYDSSITMDVFLNKINEMISEGYNEEFKVGDITITTRIDDNTKILYLDYYKNIDIKYEVEELKSEFETVADFEAKDEKYNSEEGEQKYKDKKLNEGSDLNPMVSVYYRPTIHGDFSEYFDIELTMLFNDEDIYSEDLKTVMSSIVLDENMRKELGKIDELFAGVSGYSMYDYITVDQLADSIQADLMRNRMECFGASNNLPLPGLYGFTTDISDDVYNQEGKMALSVNLNFDTHDVTAEGIKSR